jgi:hypothetical protein
MKGLTPAQTEVLYAHLQQIEDSIARDLTMLPASAPTYVDRRLSKIRESLMNVINEIYNKTHEDDTQPKPIRIDAFVMCNERGVMEHVRTATTFPDGRTLVASVPVNMSHELVQVLYEDSLRTELTINVDPWDGNDD